MADIAQIGVAFDTSGLVKGEAALDNVARTSRTTGTALDGLQNEIVQTGTAMATTAGRANQMRSPLSGLAAGFRANQFAIQNTSFQLQDIIVQLSMGTSVSRTLGQQLPQLAGAWGPVGAVVGVVAGGILSLIPLMTTLGEETDELTDQFRETLDALNSYNTLTDLSNELTGEAAMLARQLAAAKKEEEAETRRNNVALAEQNILLQQEAIARQEARMAQISPDDLGAGTDTFFDRQSQKLADMNATLNDMRRDADLAKVSLAELEQGVGDFGDRTETAATSVDRVKNATEEWLNTVRDTSSSLEDEIAQLELVNDLYVEQGKTLEEANDARELLIAAQRLGLEMYELEAMGIADLIRRKQELIDKTEEETEARKQADREREQAERKREQAEKDAEREAKRAEEAATRRYQRMADGAINAAMGAETLKDAFKEMAISIISDIIRMYAEEAMAKTMSESSGGGGGILGAIGGFDFGSIFGSVFSDGTPPIAPTANPHTFANGGAFDHRGLIPFADGGVVNRPTVFPFANGTGLMGEAGPEAIMPLQRGADGKLGVASSGGGGMVNITIINESGGEVETRQNGPNIDVIISRAVAMDIGKGGPVYQKISKTFGLSPQITGRG